MEISPGQNITIEYRWAAGREDQPPSLAADLVRLKVDIMVTSSTPAAHAAKQATATIPLVVTFIADPVGSGLVASLARPGGNITGVSTLARGLVTSTPPQRARAPPTQRSSSDPHVEMTAQRLGEPC